MQKAKDTFRFILNLMLILTCLQIFLFPMSLTAQASPFSLDEQEGFESGEMSDTYGGSGETDIRTIIIDIVVLAISFLAIIFLIMIIWGGFQWMTAQGNQERVEQAKNTIKNGVIGVIVVLAAGSITYFIFEDVRRVVTGSIW